jgi:hypothetical protein
MNIQPKLVVVGLSLILGCIFGFASSTFAQTVTPNPAVWSTDVSCGTKGKFTFMTAVTGLPAGAIVLDGPVSPDDVSLIFQVTLDPDSTSVGGAKSDFTPGSWVSVDSETDVPVTAVGWIPGDEPDALVDFAEGFGGPDTSDAWLIMDAAISGGESSDLFFISIPGASLVSPGLPIIYRVIDCGVGLIVARGTVIPAACATDISDSVSVTVGMARLDRKTGHYTQKVTLRNTSTAAFSGPISLALDGLTNASLLNSAGTIDCAEPAGSPYVEVDVGADAALSPRERAVVTLEFSANPSTYTTRVLSGSNR